MNRKESAATIAVIVLVVIVVLLAICYYVNNRTSSSSPSFSTPIAASVPRVPTSTVHIFDSLIPELKKGTTVPIRLPSKLPSDLDGLSLHASITTTTIDSYDVLIEADPNCDGADACFVGEIFAKRNGQLTGSNVSLANTINGNYQTGGCGASCSPNTIEWTQNGILYTLAFKLDKASMVSLANNMIQEGSQ